jgi:predicted ATPase
LDMGSVMQLFQETEGYPLFVVEMVRADLGRVSARTPEADRPQRQLPLEDARALPPRMQAVLAGRLLQLSASARAFVELAATIGRAFTLDLLSTVGNADAESAVRALDELWHKRIVREHGANSYDFTHDKLREVAYAEISAPQRRMLHRRVAQALDACRGPRLGQRPACVALRACGYD